MRNSAHKPLFVFLHLPKCGGMTLRHILARQFRRTGILVIGEEPRAKVKQFVNMPRLQRDAVQMIMGHLPWGLWGIEEAIDRPIIYLSMLRHPLERILSLYRYIRQTPDHYLSSFANSVALGEFVTAQRTQQEVANLQTRLLAGCENSHGYVRVLPSSAEFDYRTHGPDLLKRAIENIERPNFRALGVLEDFDRSLLKFHHEFGWSWPVYQRKNVSSKTKSYRRRELPRRARESILTRNIVDLALYEYTLEQLNNTHTIDNLHQHLEHTLFKVSNAMYGWTSSTLKPLLNVATRITRN